jgi:hypothetical protein
VSRRHDCNSQKAFWVRDIDRGQRSPGFLPFSKPQKVSELPVGVLQQINVKYILD